MLFLCAILIADIVICAQLTQLAESTSFTKLMLQTVKNGRGLCVLKRQCIIISVLMFASAYV